MDRRYRVTCMTTPRVDINIAKNTKLLIFQYSATPETYDIYLPDFEDCLDSVVMV